MPATFSTSSCAASISTRRWAKAASASTTSRISTTRISRRRWSPRRFRRLGQRFYVKTKNATAVGSPSTLAVDPLRTRIPANEEQAIALMYGFLYVTDAEEGLVVIGDPNLKSKAPGRSDAAGRQSREQFPRSAPRRSIRMAF